jgi:hypothetical protein
MRTGEGARARRNLITVSATFVRTGSFLVACSLLACSPSREDVEGALRNAESLDAANLASKTCGFTTFGLNDVKIEDLKIDGKSAGSAKVSGVAKDGTQKGVKCTGSITFHYTKARSTTQGANGESVSFPVVILDAQRVGP